MLDNYYIYFLSKELKIFDEETKKILAKKPKS